MPHEKLHECTDMRLGYLHFTPSLVINLAHLYVRQESLRDKHDAFCLSVSMFVETSDSNDACLHAFIS